MAEPQPKAGKPKFQSGDAVVLKGNHGGVIMTVLEDTGGGDVELVWFDGNRELAEAEMPCGVLEYYATPYAPAAP